MTIKRQLRLFPKVMSLYYFCNNVAIAMMTFFASILLKQYNYDALIYISILTNLFSVILLFRYIPSGSHKTQGYFKVKKVKDIIANLTRLVRFGKSFRFLVILYGVNSFFAWQFHSISSMVLLDMGLSSVEVALCGGLLKTIMGIGALFSLIFVNRGLPAKMCCLIIILYLFSGCITAVVYNPYLFYVFCALIVFLYTIIDVSIERLFECASKSNIRGTAISVAMTICSLLAIVANISFGILSNYFGGRVALFCLLFIISILMTFVLRLSK